MSDASLPGDASTRRSPTSFSSRLTAPDYSSTLSAGLEPVGIVQGVCVMRWAWYGPRSPYGGDSPIGSGTKKLKRRTFEPRTNASGRLRRTAVQSLVNLSTDSTYFNCQHPAQIRGHHESGVNFAQVWIEQLWSEGFHEARARMLAEAEIAGAHGVVGVVDEITTPTKGAKEFLLRGTAVRVRNAPPPREIWSTYLAGERLIKLVEAGWAPVSVVGGLASMRIWPACSTESQLSGMWRGVTSITQIEHAHALVRRRARALVHGEAGADDIHGVRYEVAEHRISKADDEVTCTVWGSRIRRYAPAEQLRAPDPMVVLG
jgi:hypothetical protein